MAEMSLLGRIKFLNLFLFSSCSVQWGLDNNWEEEIQICNNEVGPPCGVV